MYRNKKDVDKHVDSLMLKLSPKDFKSRAYSIARLYFEVGDYGSCQKYVEQYLSQRSNNAAAHKLLGQALQKLGQKEKAIEQYKISLDIDPTQTSTILDVCELLADNEVTIDTGRAKYWCDKAEVVFPKHPVTFSLREKILAVGNPDPEALVNLLKSELETRPKDAVLHARLIKHLLQNNKIKEAYEHSCNIEFDKKLFSNNYAWYESLSEILKYNPFAPNDWLYQLLLLTVKERLCILSLTETPNSSSKGLVESSDLLHDYDQAIDSVAKAGSSPGFREFHNSLLQHHKGQLAFHIATYLLKKAKKALLNWREAKECSVPLMLIAWQTIPLDYKVNWLLHAPEKQQKAVHRWYLEGSFRCSQSGYFLLSNMQDKSQVLLDQIAQFCSGAHWKDKLYEKIFTVPEQITKKKSSHLVSDQFNAPSLRLPRRTEVQAYDDDAQREYPNSLHHFVWILLNYKNYADFRCTLFDMLTPTTVTSCGPETLNKMDVLAFLFCATLSTQNLRDKKANYVSSEMEILPANITDLLCSLSQTKWWDCAYKFSQNELGVEYTDIRSTLSRGIEVLRCIDNHGLDPELLCILGRIFLEKANKANTSEEKSNLEIRAQLYYSSAIPLLEKLKSKSVLKLPEKRMFEYTHKQLGTKEINFLLQESKLQIALSHLNEGEYEKVINLLSNVKSPQAYYHLSETYKKIALEENSMTKNIDDKYASLLNKAKHFAYKALDKMKESEEPRSLTLYADVQSLIEELESHLNRIDIDLSANVTNDIDSSDEYASVTEIGLMQSKSNHYQKGSSTPKTRHNINVNATAYRTAIDSQTFERTQVDHLYLERIERQIKNLQKTERTINDFMDQTRNWFEENRKLGNHIINSMNSNIETTTEQFKLLKVSVDQVKKQMEECKNESKDVADLKKQIAELKKEVNKLKKPTDQSIDENDLYNLDDEYRTSDNTTFSAQLPFTAPQVVPPFAQRIMPPFSMPSNPYQLYGQNFYNLYNQYSQFAQPPTVPGAPQIFDPTRTQMNYPGVYPTPDQMYLDVAHLVPPTLPPVPAIPTVPTTHSIPVISTVPSITVAPTSTTVSSSKMSQDSKEIPKSLPVNVVITSSDPLPTCTTTPAPVLSVTIPQKHIKGSPHNYQIPLPSSTETKTVAPPVFSFPLSSKSAVTTTSSILNWNTKFLTSQAENTLSISSDNNSFKDSNTSTNVVDGVFPGFSPNTSINKSRTLSERSNTSIENYDPCPDFKPIIPLPAEVKITTGEEDETVIFSSRAKLFRLVDKQWKERGIGEIKLLKHKVTGKVRVLMRREQVHKICANHIISPNMEIKPMTNETKAYCWIAHDYAEESVILEKFCVRFKTADLGKEFYETFERARKESANTAENHKNITKSVSEISVTKTNLIVSKETSAQTQSGKTVVGGFTFSSTPAFKPPVETSDSETKNVETPKNKINVFSGLTFNAGNTFTFGNNLNLASSVNKEIIKTPDKSDSTKLNTSDVVEDFEPTVDFKPVVPLPALVEQKTGEEDEIILFEHRAKLLRFDSGDKEWKERGLGNIKLLVHKENNHKLRLLMRREQIMKVCCNHSVTKEMTFQKMPNMDKAVTWCAKDFSEGELVSETFCLRFKTAQLCDDFIEAVKAAQIKISDDTKAAKEEENAAKQNNQTGFGDKFKPKPGSWFCQTCYTNNLESFVKCACCETPNPQNTNTIKETPSTASGWGDKFKPKPGSWECKQCLIRNEAHHNQCTACNSCKDGTVKKTENTLNDVPKFNFGIPSSVTQKQSTMSLKPIILKTPEPSIFGANNVSKFTFGIPKTETINLSATTKSLNTMSTFNTSTVVSENASPINYSVKKNETETLTATPLRPALLQTPNTNIASFGKSSGTFEFSFKPKASTKGKSPVKSPKENKGDDSDDNEYASEDEGHHIHFSPVIPMPEKIEVVTGEENEEELYCHRAKLYIFNKEWKERGIGNVKILKHKKTGSLRVLMRREQIHKICLNHALVPEIAYKPKDDKTWLFYANDFSEGEVVLQHFCLRFKNKEIAMQFKDAIDKALASKTDSSGNLIQNSDTDSEGVVFVTEITASTEEKQKAKELMLPENFYTYEVKDPCPGCRGCDDDDKIKRESKKEKVKSTESNLLPNSTMITPLKSSPLVFQSPTGSVYGTPSNFDGTTNTTMFRTPLSTLKSNTTQASPSPTSFSFNDSTDKENTLTDSPNTHVVPQSISFVTGGVLQNQAAAAKPSILAAPKLNTLPIAKDNTTATRPGLGAETTSHSDENKSVFGENKSVFGENKSVFGENKSVFGENKSGSTGLANKSVFSFTPQTNKGDSQTSLFSDTNFSQVNFFSNNSQESLFGPAALKSMQSKPLQFGTGTFSFGNVTEQNQDKPKATFGTATTDVKQGSDPVSKDQVGNMQQNQTIVKDIPEKPDEKIKVTSEKSDDALSKDDQIKELGDPTQKDTLFKIDNSLTFEALVTSGPGFSSQKKPDFKWEGAGQQLFANMSAKESDNKSKNDSASAADSAAGADEEYDPHYEPIVPMPDKIIVTTGEEDEEKLFGERCKLFRFDEKSRDWKERGVGEIKILYHPQRNSYRLILRREQVYKAVLNMLLFMDINLLPLKNSIRAWTWAGRNFAESEGEQETLAVRFKNAEIAKAFYDKVMECVRKLQASAAEAIRKEKEGQETKSQSAAPLRLPKHMEEGARLDYKALVTQTSAEPKPEAGASSEMEKQENGDLQKPDEAGDAKQVHFEEPEEDHADYEEEDYEHDYENTEDYDYYYGKDEEEDSPAFYPCKAVVRQGAAHETYEQTHVQVCFDHDACSPKILVTDFNTGEILADMLIHTDTEFQLSHETCSWSGTDYTSNVSVEKAVTITFPDTHTALEFYDSCETSKASTYASTDPES